MEEENAPDPQHRLHSAIGKNVQVVFDSVSGFIVKDEAAKGK